LLFFFGPAIVSALDSLIAHQTCRDSARQSTPYSTGSGRKHLRRCHQQAEFTGIVQVEH
jgi:hypothetical protein